MSKVTQEFFPQSPKNFDNLADIKPRITVIGVGGGGGNAVNNMIESNLEGVEFIICNTDAQAMTQSRCQHRIQLGMDITKGLGAGSKPDVGRAAAEESLDHIKKQLEGTNMLFVAAGMGGGTGTGAAPVIAQAAREMGILTVGVVTKPFQFEGMHRSRSAEKGIELLQQHVDTLIVIPNQNLFRIANEKTTLSDAFCLADEVLHAGVRGVTDLMIMPGLINLDFADVRAIMSEMGKAVMGTGEASGEGRAIAAAEAAISNPLLDDVSIRGAGGVLISITGGADLTLYEVDEAANRVREEVDESANIIFGSTFDERLKGVMRVSVVATGIEGQGIKPVQHTKETPASPVKETSLFQAESAEEIAPTSVTFDENDTSDSTTPDQNDEIFSLDHPAEDTGSLADLRTTSSHLPEENAQKAGFLSRKFSAIGNFLRPGSQKKTPENQHPQDPEVFDWPSANKKKGTSLEGKSPSNKTAQDLLAMQLKEQGTTQDPFADVDDLDIPDFGSKHVSK